MDIIANSGLAMALKGSNVDDQMVNLAKEERKIRSNDIPAKWKIEKGEFSPYMAMNESDKFRKILPISWLKEHQSAWRKKAEAHLILQGKPYYEATDKAFTANPDILNKPQQEYFAQLNKIVSMLGVTPKEFDTEFRDFAAVFIRLVETNAPPKNTDESDLARKNGEYMFGYVANGLPIRATENEREKIKRWKERDREALKKPNGVRPVEALVPEEENVLQSYANGLRSLPLLQHLKIPTANTYVADSILFCNGINTAAITLADKMNIPGHKRPDLECELEKLKELEKQAFQWPDELEKAAAQERTQKDHTAAREAEEARRAADAERIKTQAEAARKAREAAEALAPTPYTIDLETAAGAGTAFGRISRLGTSERWKDIRNPDVQEQARLLAERMKYLHRQEIEPLRELFNTKLPGHRELADVLFDETTLKRAEYACVGESRKGDKIAAHSDAFRQRAEEALFNFFTQPTEGLAEEQRQRYEQIQERIFQSPALIVALLGSDDQLRDLRATHERLLAEQKPSEENMAELNSYHYQLATSLLKAIGIENPAAEFIITPTIAAPAIPAHETTGHGEADGSSHLQVIALSDVHDLTETESPTHVSAIRETQDGVSIFEPVAVTPLTPEPELPNLAAQAAESKTNALHAEVFEKAKQFFTADIGGVIARAQDQGLRFFECSVDVNKANMPIVLKFSKEIIGDDGVPRRAQITHTINNHGSYFKNAGLTMTVEDATDLKQALQSAVMQEEKNFFVGPVFTRKTGVVDVAYDAPLPKDAYNVEKLLDAQTADGSGGLCTLVYEADYQSPYRKIKGEPPQKLHISIPLGIARKPAKPEEQAAIETEIEERKLKVMELIENAKLRGEDITKADIVRDLENWVRDRDQSWEKWKREKLPEFNKERILHRGPGDNGQKITLAPISLALAPGGDNPSWGMNIHIYAGNNQDKHRGTLICDRYVNLHTRDQELAEARAQISLLGQIKPSGEHDTRYALLPMIQRYMQEHPDDQWHGKNPTYIKNSRNMGKDKRLEDFFDDMKRYEHDVRMYPRLHYNDDGTATLTLSVGRSNDLNKPETLFIKKVDKTRVPLQLQMKLPKKLVDEGNLEQKLDAFLTEVNKGFNWTVGDFYSPVNPVDGERQNVKKYSVDRIKGTMVRAIKGSYEKFFGQSLPKNWENESAAWIDVVDGERIRRTRSPNKPKTNHIDRAQQPPEDRPRGV